MRFVTASCVVVFAVCFLPFSQHGAATPPITPFDEYGNICWQDEQARLNNFAIQLQNNPNLIGYIVIYAGRVSCRGEANYRGTRARNWVLKRGVESKRVIFKDGGFRPDIQNVLHLQRRDKPEYQTQPTLTKDQVSIRSCRDKVFARVICLTK